MNGYNTAAIGEDRATLGSDPNALMVAYSMGGVPRVPPSFRPMLVL